MKTAPQAQHPAIETAPLHRSHLIVDGNSHRTDLCRHPLPEGKQAALISEARADAAFATMIAVAAERVRAMKRAHEALQASVPVEPHSIGCEAHQALATQLRQ